MEHSEEFKRWSEKYHNKEIVDLKKHFTEKEFEILKKLGIEVKDKIYTEYEFELLDMAVMKYYKDDDLKLSKEELKFCLDLETTGVSKEEYETLLKKIDEINSIYNF